MDALLLSTDRLDLLRLFVAAAEAGKISAAADAVGISQPSASRLLKRLELMLGSELLRRTASGVTLTSTGTQLLVTARQLLQQWEALSVGARAQQQALVGPIRVAAPVAAGQGFLATLIARFLSLHPEVTIDFTLTDEQIDLRATGYDLWVRAGSVRSDKVIVREILSVNRGLFCAPALGSAQEPRELLAVKAIRLTPFVPEEICLTRQDGETYRLKQSTVFATNNLYAARAAALAGVGYAVLPLWAVRSDTDSSLLLRTCAAWVPDPLQFSMVYLPDRNRPVRVKTLIRYLQHEVSGAAGIRQSHLELVEAFRLG